MIHPPTPTSRRHRNQVVQVPHWHWNKIRHRKQRIEYIRMSSTLGWGECGPNSWGSGKDQMSFFDIFEEPKGKETWIFLWGKR